jgi:hypothetical protein
MKRMQRKLREEELRILRGEQNMDMDAFDDNMKVSHTCSIYFAQYIRRIFGNA